jgi:acyl-CoA thioesterase
VDAFAHGLTIGSGAGTLTHEREVPVAELDEALAVAWDAGPATASAAPARGCATVGDGWSIGHALNGGVLMALATHALGEGLSGVGHPDPLTWSASFLSAATPGEVEVHAEVLRVGRTLSTAQARLVQDEDGRPVERVRVVASLGDAARTDPVHRAPTAPDMPPPDACLPASRQSSPLAEAISMLDRLDVRVDPSTAGFAVGRPSGRGVIRAWLRMRDGREPDVAMLPYAVDALMPVAFDLGAPGWAPTLELTGQVLGRPAPGWLVVELSTDTVVGDLLVEDAAVWDATGRLVARSRQLAGIRLPGN